MTKTAKFRGKVIFERIFIPMIVVLEKIAKQLSPFLIAFVALVISIPFAAHAKEFVAIGIHFPPLMFEKDGKPAGFYYEMLQLIQKRMPDVKIKTEFYPTKRMLKIIKKKNNAFALGIARTAEREPSFKWVGPSITTTMGLFKLKNRPDILIRSESDIKMYKIGTGRGYAFNEILKDMGVPESKIEVVDSDIQNVNKLYINRISLMATLDIVIAEVLKQTEYSGDEFELAYVMGKSDMYYAFNKSIEDSFIIQFQNTLDQVRKTDEYSKLVKRYIPE